MNKSYYVYIIINSKNGTLYIGVTNDLRRRIYEHKKKLIDGFTKRHSLDKLVYYEETSNIESAITREKQMKKWKRGWKIELIEEKNPSWDDLYASL